MANPPGGFRPVRSRELRDAVGTFLLAQGWAGLHCGDTLRRLEAGRADFELLASLGSASEVRAIALVTGSRLNLFVPNSSEVPAAASLVQARLAVLDRISCLEAHLPHPLDHGFEVHRREMTVAASLRVPGRALPAVRPAGPADADQLWRVYDPVPWMRLESPADWAVRVAEERTWVAEIDGEVVAAARWTKVFGTVVEVGGVATDPSRRRLGAGTAVVLAATAAALTDGMTPVLCFGDPELAPLYYGLGFELVGTELAFRRRSG